MVPPSTPACTATALPWLAPRRARASRRTAAAVLRMGFAVYRAVDALWTNRYPTVQSVIARRNGLTVTSRVVPATWIYCEGGPKRGLRLSGGRSGDVVIFTGHGSRHYYRVVARTQWTSTEGRSRSPCSTTPTSRRFEPGPAGVTPTRWGTRKLCDRCRPTGVDKFAGVRVRGSAHSFDRAAAAGGFPEVWPRRGPRPAVDTDDSRPMTRIAWRALRGWLRCPIWTRRSRRNPCALDGHVPVRIPTGTVCQRCGQTWRHD